MPCRPRPRSTGGAVGRMAPVRSLGAEALARPRLEPHGTARLRENQTGAPPRATGAEWVIGGALDGVGDSPTTGAESDGVG